MQVVFDENEKFCWRGKEEKERSRRNSILELEINVLMLSTNEG
jgi:hypothetical protein